MSRSAKAPIALWVTALGALVLVSCGGGSGKSEPDAIQPPPDPPGFLVSDTPHWRFAYPPDWTTDESTGSRGENLLNVRGPYVTAVARCAAFAVWGDDYAQDLVKATRALLVTGEPDQEVIIDETFTAPGARQALRIERTYPERATDGSVVRLHAYELHFLRDDRVAIGFGIAAPVGHEEECHAERMLRSFTMKPPPEG